MAAAPPVEKLVAELDPESEQFGLLYDPTRTGDWIESFLTIPNEHGTIVKMELYPQQHMMLDNQTGRDNTVKGRQTRASSLILARNLRRMTTNFGLNCFVMTQDDPTTQTFRWRIKHHLTDLARAGLKYDIVMDNENELVIGGLENRFIWASAEQRVAGRAYCVTPETRVLKADLRWVPAGELVVGDQIIAFDEEAQQQGLAHRPSRHFQQATITAASRRVLPVYELELDDGTVVRATGEHKWLGVRSSPRHSPQWVSTETLAAELAEGVHWSIPRYMPVWEEDHSYEAGFLAGALDADGCLARGQGHAPSIRFAQLQNCLLDKVLSVAAAKGFDFRDGAKATTPRSAKPMFNPALRSWQESVRFLGTFRPVRLLQVWEEKFDIAQRELQRIATLRVVRVQAIGEREVAALTSSSGTYLAEGLPSHNTINIFHGSEAAHWKPENEGAIVGGILPAIPDPPFGWADFESTPNGAEGLFYDQVMESRPIEDFALWSTWFYPWYLEPRYTVDTWNDNDLPQHYYDMIAEMRRTFIPMPDEAYLLDEKKLSMGQILWRRLKMREMSRTTTPFLQEYPEDLQACFLSTAESFFASDDGQDHLGVHRLNLRSPIQRLSMLPFRESVVQFRGSNLSVWETPNLSTPYAMYQDTSKGGTSKDSDPSVIIVLNAKTGHMVAKLVVKATPREVAEMGCAIGQYYNMALYGGERDAWGSQALDRVRELSYPNVFYYLDPQRMVTERRQDPEPWIYPTEQNRDRMLLRLREGMFDHSLVIPDQATLLEMGAFTWVKLRDRHKLRGQGKRTHDDHVMATAGCTMVAEIAARARPRKEEAQNITIGRYGQVIRTSKSGPKFWMR